jgi:hypothetical protein
LVFLPSTIFAADLLDLVSASNNFEVAMIEHEHVLERNPTSSTEIAASTIKYVKAKERHFVALRKIVPTLIDMATGKTPKTPEVDKIREIFSGYGETQEKQLEAATVPMLKTWRFGYRAAWLASLCWSTNKDGCQPLLLICRCQYRHLCE